MNTVKVQIIDFFLLVIITQRNHLVVVLITLPVFFALFFANCEVDLH